MMRAFSLVAVLLGCSQRSIVQGFAPAGLSSSLTRRIPTRGRLNTAQSPSQPSARSTDLLTTASTQVDPVEQSSRWKFWRRLTQRRNSRPNIASTSRSRKGRMIYAAAAMLAALFLRPVQAWAGGGGMKIKAPSVPMERCVVIVESLHTLLMNKSCLI